MATAGEDWKVAAANWKARYPTCELQAEFFLLKFQKDADIARQAVYKLMEQFSAFDGRKQGELEEHEALRLLESRNSTKTFRELREMVADIDLDHNRKLSFLEWACAIFNKSWQKLHEASVDPEELAKALALSNQAEAELAKAALSLAEKEEEERKAAEFAKMTDEQKIVALEQERLHREAVAAKKAKDEHEKKEAEEKRLRELGQAGVKGRAAAFHYAGTDTVDQTRLNQLKITEDARNRKEKARLEAEMKQKEEDAARAAAAAIKAAEEKAVADAIAAEAARKRAEAEEERKKAELGGEASRKEKEAYEKAKAEHEAQERVKKEEEERKKAESRARLAAKAQLWK